MAVFRATAKRMQEFGPYPNEGTVDVGDACYGTKN